MLTLESVETDPETGGSRKMSMEDVSALKDGDLVDLAPILAVLAFNGDLMDGVDEALAADLLVAQSELATMDGDAFLVPEDEWVAGVPTYMVDTDLVNLLLPGGLIVRRTRVYAERGE